MVAGGVVSVAEVDEGFGFAVAVAVLPVKRDGALVAGDGLVVVVEVVMGIAKAVPGAGLPVPPTTGPRPPHPAVVVEGLSDDGEPKPSDGAKAPPIGWMTRLSG